MELEKRRTGKYPDVLKDLPKDIFGEPLVYRKGKILCLRERWNARKKHVEERKEAVDAVAVWSKGPRRPGDPGEDKWKPGGRWFGSVCARILLDPQP